jgi:hypothetical protein
VHLDQRVNKLSACKYIDRRQWKIIELSLITTSAIRTSFKEALLNKVQDDKVLVSWALSE